MQDEHRWRDIKFTERQASAVRLNRWCCGRLSQKPNNPFRRETEKSVYKMFKELPSRVKDEFLIILVNENIEEILIY